MAWISETKPTTTEVRRAHKAAQAAGRALDARPGGGLQIAALGFADMNTIVAGFEHLVTDDGRAMGSKTRSSPLSMFFKVLRCARVGVSCGES
ncbi:hypothetical protein E1267_06520 [Nonomuraea longispora]|uniref:Uncharacterized protein n=1 Tax=Nonomuraea longispora TaxID=1848320 RepID=A0A4R4NLR9_9ACTN|nr:hypothetical protein [Nonomuraea longispora]TDC09684.1 hypothetical protein E1267_06520 [Nonomuraea longispora]